MKMVSLLEFPERSLYWPKSTRKHVYALPKSMLISLMGFGQIFCGLMRPKLSSMVTWEVGTFRAHQKQLSKKRIWYQQSNTEVGAFYYGVSLHHQVQANCFTLKASCLPRNFGRKHWSISEAAGNEMLLGVPTGQRPETYKCINKVMDEKKEIQAFGMAKPKPWFEPNRNVVVWPEAAGACKEPPKHPGAEAFLHGRMGQNSCKKVSAPCPRVQKASTSCDCC